MEIMQYTEHQKEFRKKVSAFVDKYLLPNIDQWEKDKIVPRSVFKKMGEEGFLSPSILPEYGGMGGDFRYNFIVGEECSRINGCGVAAGLHSDVVAPYIEIYGSEEQKKKYLPGCVTGDIQTSIAMTDPEGGSDVAGMRTSAIEKGDEVIINGAKTFISGGINTGLVVLAAKNPDVENPYEAISLYLVDEGTKGFEKGRNLEKMGWYSQDTAELFFTDCRIPIKNRLGKKGSGFYMMMEKLQQERVSLAMGMIFAAERMLEETIEYCKNTVENGAFISKRQACQFALVEIATEVKLGRTFIEKIVMDHVNGKKLVIEASMIKYWAADLVEKVANTCIDLFGETAIAEEKCPMARRWRDIRVFAIVGGTTEIMKGIIAKFIGL